MPEILDHIAYLSHEIGPRPAGTEEEQQAALYITEQLQKEAGLSAVIEDFNSESNGELPTMICCALSLIFAVAGMFLPVMAIPSFIVLLLAGVLFTLEALEKPFLSKFLARGVSQNVVAKYEPGISSSTGGSRRRKILVVANYDSGKVRAELKPPFLGILGYLQKATLVSMVFLPIVFLIRALFFLYASGITAIVLNVVTIIALLFLLATILVALAHKFSSYNEAANNNASGTAVLLEVAKRIGRGYAVGEQQYSHEDRAYIHGEAAARESGLVPEGADLVYESPRSTSSETRSEKGTDRLSSAKAAIAAMTGQAVAQGASTSSVADNLVQVRESYVPGFTDEGASAQRTETREAFTGVPQEVSFGAAQSYAPEERLYERKQEQGLNEEALAKDLEEQAEGVEYIPIRQPSSEVPDWFKKAQENAKKPKNDKPLAAQRSRFADALDKAVAESSTHFNEANKAVDVEMEERLAQMRSSIMEGGLNGTARNHDGAAEQSAHPKSGSRAGRDESDEAYTTRPAAVTSVEVPDEGMLPSEEPSSQNRAGVGERQGTLHPVNIRAEEPRVADDRNAARFSGGGTIAMPPIDVSTLRDTQIPSSAGDNVGRPPYDEFAASAPTEEHFQDESYAKGVRSEVSDESLSSAAKQPVTLPEIGIPSSNVSSVAEASKQRAPLAMAQEESSQSAAKSLLSMLPSIGSEDLSESQESSSVGTRGEISATDLKTSLPSLSGSLSPIGSTSGGQGSVSTTGSFAPAGATGAFAPVGEELLENVDPEDVYIEDADDSVFEDNFTESGAFAGPGYVEMPKSRTGRFFKRFGSKKKEKNMSGSTQEWLDVDDDFDARSVGAARGGWESFQEPQDDYYEQDEYYDEEQPDDSDNPRGDGRSWQGGAFSKIRSRGFRKSVSFDDEEDQDSGTYEQDVNPLTFTDEAPRFSRREVVSFDGDAVDVSADIGQIHEFRASGFDTEIWFVALGSELAHNGGMRALMAEHAQDMRGAIIINIEALGSGELSLVEKEGVYRPRSLSSRMKRYIKKTSQETGIEVDSAHLLWKESAASIASRHGYQAMSLVGIEGQKPAKFAQADDIFENIEEESLYRNVEFLFRLLKNI